MCFKPNKFFITQHCNVFWCCWCSSRSSHMKKFVESLPFLETCLRSSIQLNEVFCLCFIHTCWTSRTFPVELKTLLNVCVLIFGGKAKIMCDLLMPTSQSTIFKIVCNVLYLSKLESTFIYVNFFFSVFFVPFALSFSTTRWDKVVVDDGGIIKPVHQFAYHSVAICMRVHEQRKTS